MGFNSGFKGLMCHIIRCQQAQESFLQTRTDSIQHHCEYLKTNMFGFI